MAIMAAINIIFSLLAEFIPLVGAILIIFLPLTSAIVETVCEDKYFIIYALATIGLSVVISLSSFDFTIFYLVPAIISGYIFGLCNKFKVDDYLCIFISAIFQTALSFALIPLMNLISERDFLTDLTSILKINNSTAFSNLIILIFFLIALIQSFLSFIVVSNELTKFGIKNTSNIKLFSCLLITLCSALAIIPFAYIYPGFAYLFEGISLYFGLVSIIKINKIFGYKQFISLSIIVVVNIFIFAALYNVVSNGLKALLFGITPFLYSLLFLIFSLLKKRKSNIQ